MITDLEPNQIFVFGSNLAGYHSGGAAAYAFDRFGAELGVGEGLTAKCYAFPTLGYNLEKRSREELEESRNTFYKCASFFPEYEFLMTPVGTGIAGFTHEEMKSLFMNPPSNIRLPEEWEQ